MTGRVGLSRNGITVSVNLYDVPNSIIEQAILNAYKTEKNRNIVRDRLVGGMTYEAIIRKYYPESDWRGRRDEERMRLKIKSMAKNVEKRLKLAKGERP